MEFWMVAEGVRRRSGMEMDRLEAYGELEDYILFWVNMPVLDFARDFSSKAHLQRLQDRRILRSTFHIRESSCTFAIQFRDSEHHVTFIDDPLSHVAFQNVLDVFLRRLSL